MPEQEVLFDPFPKQIEFLEAVFSGKYRVILYGGSIRGGKTFSGLGALILLCRFYPKSRWAVVRDSLPTLKRNTLPSWDKIKPTNFIESHNQETQTVTFKNGSQIIFFPENFYDDKELDRWKGLEVNGFLFEEANECQQKSFYKAIERAGSHVLKNKPKPLVLLTCNPNNTWVKTLIYDKWKDESLPESWCYIPAKIFDNPYVTEDQDYMESLKLMPDYEYEVFVNGNWDIELKTGSEYANQFNWPKHVITCGYEPDLPLYLSFDFNVSPYCTAIAAQVHVDQLNKVMKLRIFKSFPDAFEQKRDNSEELSEDILEVFKNHKAGVYYFGDFTGANSQTVTRTDKHNYAVIDRVLFQILSEDSRNVRSNPPITARRRFLNKLLYGTTFSDGYTVHIEFDPSCNLLIDDVNGCKKGKDGGKNKEMFHDSAAGTSYQKYGHFLDALEYLIVGIFPEYFQSFSR